MKFWPFVGGVCVCACVVFRSDFVSADVVLHVALNGDDQAAGTLEAPLASIAGARDRIRDLRSTEQWTPEPIQVWIAAGTYYLQEPILFDERDSGTVDAPITYQATREETVTLHGGYPLSVFPAIDSFEDYAELTAQARQHVLIYQLENSVVHTTFIPPSRHPDQPTSPASIELYDRSGLLLRAGWPNQGWANLSESHTYENSWSVPLPLTSHALKSAWAHGYWEHNYQDLYLPLESAEHGHGSTRMRLQGLDTQLQANARYRIENLLACLDSPGEWYVNVERNHLIVWPTSADQTELCLSQIPTIISMFDVEYVSLVGLGVRAATTTGIEIAGGAHCTIDHCHVNSIGNVGINVYHGRDHAISHCRVSATGASGMRIEGGDRKSLLAAGHCCANNHVTDCGYSHRARRAGIEIHGVGITLEQNEIAALPDWAVHITGNDHVVHRNHIHHVCRETSDSGAIYLAHDPTYRGNSICHNHVHSIGGFDDKNVMAIYLDDFVSETLIEGNVIHDSPRGIVIGGGRDNIVRNNAIHNCLAAIQIDSRGSNWAKHWTHEHESKTFAGNTTQPLGFHRCLEHIRHDQGIYAERYPKLATLLDDEPGVAKGNRIESNGIECPVAIDLQNIERELVVVRNNTRRLDEVYLDAIANNFKLRDTILAKQLNVVEIPFEKIGPQSATGKLVSSPLSE